MQRHKSGHDDLLFFPDASSLITIEYLQRMRDGKEGIPIGIREVDDYLVPPRAGELVVVLARPGMGKSSLLAHYAQRMAVVAASSGDKVGYPVVVTAEMAVEEYQLRRASSRTGISASAIKRGVNEEEWSRVGHAVTGMVDNAPIIYVGHSIHRSRTRPPLTIENVWRCLETLADDHGVFPSIVCIDYLQRMKLDRASRDRRQEMSEVVEKCKDMAIAFRVPVFLGSQASRSVDDRKPPIPALHDGKETGNIEETPDVVLGLFRPISVFDAGEIIPKTSPGLVCDPRLFYMNVLKQRGGEAGKGFWLWFDMAVSKLSDLEGKIETIDLNKWEDE